MSANGFPDSSYAACKGLGLAVRFTVTFLAAAPILSFVSCSDDVACKLDKDCPGSLVCHEARCIEPERICGNELCPEGQVCVRGKCEPSTREEQSGDATTDDIRVEGEPGFDAETNQVLLPPSPFGPSPLGPWGKLVA